MNQGESPHTSGPADPPPATWIGAVGLGALGAGAFGAVEAGEVLLGGGLHPGALSATSLVLTSVALAALVGGVVALAVRLFAGGGGGLLYVLVGVAAVMSADLGVTWFSDPPPFQDPFPLQGHPLAFLAVGVVVPGALAVLAGTLARRRRWAWWSAVGALSLVAAARLALAVPGDAGVTPPDGAPSVLLVTLDTARADRYGTRGVDTAAFDRVAAEGVRFDLAMAQIPVTGPSHATVLTGVAPWEHGMLLNGAPLPREHIALSQVLAEGGYRTGAFVSAYVLNGNLGFARGFEVYDDDFGLVKGLSRVLPGRAWAMVRRRADRDHLLERRGDRTVDDALRWLEAQGGPWLAWVHLFDPHGPYAPPPPYDERYYRGKDPRDPTNRSMDQVSGVAPYLLPHLEGITDVEYVRARYDGEVAWADDQLERLLDWLDASGRAEHTLVVVAGDHGEGLGEQGEWFNHGDWLHDHDLHVPLAMRFPGRIPAGEVVSAPAELTDIAPTIADYLGLDPLDGATGVSLRPALEGGDPPRLVARSLCYDREANRAARESDPDFPPTWRMASVRGPRERYLHREHPDHQDRFQDWGGDGERPELRALLEDQSRLLLRAAGDATAPDLGASDRQMLEALGYAE